MANNHFKIHKGVTLAPQTSEPANPTNGDIYYDSTLNKFRKYENGAWSELSSGQSSKVNYINNPLFESNVDDVNVTANITKSVETTNKIRGDRSLKLTIDTLATTADNADITMRDVDAADFAKEVTISFEYATDVNYSSDDVQFVLRNTDSSVDVPIFNDDDGKLQATGGLTTVRKFVGVAVLDDVDNSYDLRMNVLVAPGTDSNIIIDNVIVGPAGVVPGFISTEWKSYTPTTQGLGTPTINFAQWKRLGDSIQIQVKLTTGTVTASEAQVSLPENFQVGSGYSLDLVGDVQRNAATDAHYTVLATADDTFLNFGLRSGSTAAAFTARNGDALWGSSTEIAFFAELKIKDLANSVLISSEESLFQTVRAIYEVSGSTANLGFADNTLEVVDYDSKVVDTHNTVTTGASWLFTAPRDGDYLVTSTLQWDTSTNLLSDGLEVRKNGTLLRGIISESLGTAELTQAGSGATVINLVKGDTLDFRAFQNSSPDASRNIETDSGRNSVSIISLPDFSRFSEIEDKNKVQTKILSANVTSDGVMSDLTFNNLVIGKQYEISGQFRLDLDSGASDTSVSVDVIHDSSTIGRCVYQVRETTDSNSDISTYGISIKFKASATSLTFDAVSASANSLVAGDGTRGLTFVQLEERNDLIETTEF